MDEGEEKDEGEKGSMLHTRNFLQDETSPPNSDVERTGREGKMLGRADWGSHAAIVEFFGGWRERVGKRLVEFLFCTHTHTNNRRTENKLKESKKEPPSKKKNQKPKVTSSTSFIIHSPSVMS